MTSFARENSTTSSSDTYLSCMTHLPTSPPVKGRNPPLEMLRNNIYVNPIDGADDTSSFTNYNFVENTNCASKHGSENIKCMAVNANNDECNVFPEQIVQRLDDGLIATWQRFNSQPPLQGTRFHDDNDVTRASQARDRSHGGSLKRHRSETSHERHLHFGEVIERTFSSTDNIIRDMQGFPKPKLKFRKAVSLAGKLHGSPSTGRKLANYHLIANPKSVTSENMQHLLSAQEETAMSPTRRSTSSLIDLPPPKKKSILKKDINIKDDPQNLLKPSSRNFYYDVNKGDGNQLNFNSFSLDDKYDNLNVTADTTHPQNTCLFLTAVELKTGNLDNNMHQPAQQPPKKQQSTDSYTDDSQLNIFDKSTDEVFEISDSLAINVFNPNKANIWQNSDSHGIIAWQTDTSPSDNLENDGSCFGSISYDHTPSDDNFSDHQFHKLSPTADMRDVLENNKQHDTTANSDNDRNKIIPLDTIMNNLQRQSSGDGGKQAPSPGASG